MPPASLVTGASRGIGLALAERLAARGPTVGTHRGAAPADLPAVRWERLDVTDPESHRALAGRLDGLPLSLLVCNAGILPDRHEPVGSGYPAAMWAEVFATNVTGVFLTVQSLLPNLRAASGARVAIIASQMGSSQRASGNALIYRASKAAAINLGRNLAQALSADGIAVGIYHPGWVRTGMGGASAAVAPAASAEGLIDRFDALSPATTGCFLDWDGQPLPF